MSESTACPACGTRLRGSAGCAYCAAEARNGTLRQTAMAMALLGLAVADGGCGGTSLYGAILTPDDDGYAACVQLGDTDGADTDAVEDTDPATCDCNDYDPTVHPGAEETPGDGTDSNCDGEDDT